MAKKKKRNESRDWLVITLLALIGVLLVALVGFLFLLGQSSSPETFIPMATPTALNQFTETFDNNARDWQLGAPQNTIANGVLTLGSSDPVTVPYQPTYGYTLALTYITGEVSTSNEGISIIGVDVENMGAQDISNNVLGQLTTILPPDFTILIDEGFFKRSFTFRVGENLVYYAENGDQRFVEEVTYVAANRIRIDNAYDYVALYINDSMIFTQQKAPASDTPQTIQFMSKPSFENLDNGKQVIVDDVFFQ